MSPVLRRAKLSVLVVVAVLVGAIGATTALLAAVALTGSRALGAIAGALVLVLGTGGLAMLAARKLSRGRRRRWLPVAVTGATLVAIAAVVGLLAYAPAPPYTPSAASADTRYWELPTGSRIAHTFTPAAGASMPTPVVLVHGGPGAPSGEQVRLKASLADAGFDVYGYHQVGAGLSERLAVGPRVTHDLLPDSQMDGVFQSLVGRIDLWSGCREEQRPAERKAGDGPAGVGFWVNATTSLDAQRLADPRPVLRNVSTPLLVLRGECDYRAWEATREYRDPLPNAVLLAIDDAGHAIPADRPGLYVEAVRAFLRAEPLPQEPYTAADPPR